MKRRFILDTDGGVDDAQALMLLAGNGHLPLAITTVFGNVALAEATANILAVLACLGLEIPVHPGCGRALVQAPTDAKDVHGEDGLGGAPRPARTAPPVAGHAVDVMRDTLAQALRAGERVDLLMIGPLTNLALVLRLDPLLAGALGRVVIMGGTIGGRGNITPASEFNIHADPEAAAIVFGADLDILMVPWESCEAHAMPGAEIDRLAQGVAPSPARDMALALAAQERLVCRRRGLGDLMMFIDPLAAAALITPQAIAQTEEAAIGVVLADGIARGATIVDPSGRLAGRRHTILRRFDRDTLFSLYAGAIGAGGARPKEDPTGQIQQENIV